MDKLQCHAAYSSASHERFWNTSQNLKHISEDSEDPLSSVNLCEVPLDQHASATYDDPFLQALYGSNSANAVVHNNHNHNVHASKHSQNHQIFDTHRSHQIHRNHQNNYQSRPQSDVSAKFKQIFKEEYLKEEPLVEGDFRVDLDTSSKKDLKQVLNENVKEILKEDLKEDIKEVLKEEVFTKDLKEVLKEEVLKEEVLKNSFASFSHPHNVASDFESTHTANSSCRPSGETSHMCSLTINYGDAPHIPFERPDTQNTFCEANQNITSRYHSAPDLRRTGDSQSTWTDFQHVLSGVSKASAPELAYLPTNYTINPFFELSSSFLSERSACSDGYRDFSGFETQPRLQTLVDDFEEVSPTNVLKETGESLTHPILDQVVASRQTSTPKTFAKGPRWLAKSPKSPKSPKSAEKRRNSALQGNIRFPIWSVRSPNYRKEKSRKSAKREVPKPPDPQLTVDTFSKVRLHKCTICNKDFKRPSSYRIHYTIHSGEKNFSCSKCGRFFNVKSNLTRHEKLHGRAGGPKQGHSSKTSVRIK